MSLFGSLCLNNNDAFGTIEISQVLKYIRLKKSKFSQSCIFLHYPNSTASRNLLLLSGDIERNPGWHEITIAPSINFNGIMQPTNPTLPANSNHGISGGKIHCIPMHISVRKHINHFTVGQQQTTCHTLITIPRTPCSRI